MRHLDGGTTWAFVPLLLCGSALAGYMAFQKPTPKPPAVVSVTPRVADFGTVGQGESKVAEFKVTNDLPLPVEMLTVQTSCSCTKFELEPKHLPPGEVGTVKLHWSSATSRGAISLPAMLIVKYPDGKNVGFQLLVNATVQPDILFTPDSLTFTAGKSETQRVTLTPGRAKTFEMKEAYPSHSSFSVKRVGDTPAFDVTYTPEPGGGLPPRLAVNVQTDSKNEPTLVVPITVTGTDTPSVPSVMPGDKR